MRQTIDTMQKSYNDNKNQKPVRKMIAIKSLLDDEVQTPQTDTTSQKTITTDTLKQILEKKEPKPKYNSIFNTKVK